MLDFIDAVKSELAGICACIVGVLNELSKDGVLSCVSVNEVARYRQR